jgi:hypothetical protein
MKKILILLICFTCAQTCFSQKAIRVSRFDSQRINSDWQVDKEVFQSGDTLVFIFKNNYYYQMYCYTGTEFYDVYKIVKGKEILLADTTFRGYREPVQVMKGETVTVKKIITQPGNYVMKYPVFAVGDGAVVTRYRIDMAQKFDVEVKK